MVMSATTFSIVAYRLQESRRAFALGWALTPLRGKVPILRGWQSALFPTEAQVVAWARAGNVGLRTGAVSGVVVVDVDTAKGADATALNLPATVTVVTGSGGLHHYFAHTGGAVSNSVGRLSAHVDVRGDGGQVVFVGSVHPDTGRAYRWKEGHSPDEMELQPLPTTLFPPRRVIPTPRRHRQPHGLSRYGRAALRAEVERVRTAANGNRNDQLNLSSFSLGRLVGGGALVEEHAVDGLMWAAREAGLSDREAVATIRSGIRAGKSVPRGQH